MRQTDNVCLVRALGEIDLQAAAELDSVLTEVQGDVETHVILDLWDMTVIDSVGLGVLLSARRRSERGLGGFSVVAERHGRVETVFALAGLTDALPVYATCALATETLRKPRGRSLQREVVEEPPDGRRGL